MSRRRKRPAIERLAILHDTCLENPGLEIVWTAENPRNLLQRFFDSTPFRGVATVEDTDVHYLNGSKLLIQPRKPPSEP